MKKGTFILLAVILLAAIVSQKDKCSGGNIGQGKVTVEKVTVKGDETPSPVVDSAGQISSYDIKKLQDERDLYFSKYLFERKRAETLAQDIGQLDSSILATTDCKEALRLSQIQIARLKEQFERDTALIAALFAEFDKKGGKNEYNGTVKGPHFETRWRATVFGVMPSDGMFVTTDVTYDSTTVETPVERFRKNSLEAFTGINTNEQIFVGLGYERRGKTLGAFTQSDYTPLTNQLSLRAGFKIHF